MTKDNKNKVEIICEIGVNHNGDVDIAKRMIDVAVECGADTVKFQTFTAQELVSSDVEKAAYQKENTGSTDTQYEMLKALELSQDGFLALQAHAQSQEINFLSTPFTIYAVEQLEELGMERWKVASGEIVNAPLLLRMAQTGKPVILSTGMSTMDDIQNALGVLAFGYLNMADDPCFDVFAAAFLSADGQKALQEKVTILHCTSNYPAALDEIHLCAMDSIADQFGLPVGYSDHSAGTLVSLAAAARGARMVEKHFTLDQEMVGPDHKASLEPAEFKLMVEDIRRLEICLGDPEKRPSNSEKLTRKIARQSLVALVDIDQGAVFTPDNLTTRRAGEGVSPLFYWEFLGTKAERSYKAGALIQSR